MDPIEAGNGCAISRGDRAQHRNVQLRSLPKRFDRNPSVDRNPMTLTPPTACKAPLCGDYAVERGWCVQHSKENPPTSGFASGRYDTQFRKLYDDRRWRHPVHGLKVLTLALLPICTKCNRRASAHVHHKVAHRGNPALFFDPQNLTAVCQPCHAEETAAEIAARRGKPKTESPLTGNIITGGV